MPKGTGATQPFEGTAGTHASTAMHDAVMHAEQAKDQGGGGKQPAPTVERKIIFTADVQLVVTDVGKAEQELYQFLQDNKGFVTQSEVTGTAGATRNGTWKLRVPATK